jgi:hypothetical protein
LSTLNKTVDAVNDHVLDNYLDGEVMVFQAAHEIGKDSAGNGDGIGMLHASQEYMASVVQSGTPNATLRLKKGCVLLLAQASPPRGDNQHQGP